MNANQFLHLSAQILFIALSIVALVDYVRHRNPRRRDFALLACSLGIPLGITLLKDVFGIRIGLLDLLGALVLFSQPYFLYRLLQYYRPSRRWLQWAVLLGMVLCWVILFLFIASYPAITQAVIFGYCVIVDAYCTWGYSRGIQGSVGILRRRFLLIVVSSGLFTLAMAGNVASALLPNLAQIISAVGLAVTSISAVLFYLAFVPPQWLRNAWQFVELRAFLRPASSSINSTFGMAECFQQLCSAASQAVNGMMSAVVCCDHTTGTWTILASTDPSFVPNILANGQQVLDDVWQQRQPRAVYVPDIRQLDQRRRMQAVGARTWLLAPILTAEHIWGVLVVLLRDRSLFIDDDISLLELFAQQCAIIQENRSLIDELQGYSALLERHVEERTAELRESEAALRELNATLEERVKERTAELRRSNEELDRFAYAASHDLKAPLRAIQHLANWIQHDAADVLPSSSREHLAKLQGRVRRMETLLDDLLAYSRVGRQRHSIELVDTAELVDSVIEILAPPAGFTVNIAGKLPVLQVERPPLEAVFRNLIGNAVKHHHRATEGIVEICAREHEEFVEFTVADDGPGIAPEYHQRIFDIFQTLQPRDQVESSGIGLAIVKKSVERHGGVIQVESALGKGATFRFTWPKTVTSSAADA